MDYNKYYNLESYLFNQVNKSFEQRGWLNAEEFFCIVIWKSNRSKSLVAARLLNKGYNNLGSAVKSLTSNIRRLKSNKEKFFYITEEWGFRLPIASAVLTVLYPEDFTVYDYRARESLGKQKDLTAISNIERLWNEYSKYVQDVISSTPDHFSLRDKDRYLWGKSFYNQLMKDLLNKFGKNIGH